MFLTQKTFLKENSAVKNVFIINAHEAYPFSEGKLNATLVEKATTNQENLEVQFRILDVIYD
ncbi:hypothetical protein AM10699_42850 [Acaryochloris marina MBIC10699]|nr:hypothetical protein AM10699_42850 [Acaryochloris marina MBIC10699]